MISLLLLILVINFIVFFSLVKGSFVSTIMHALVNYCGHDDFYNSSSLYSTDSSSMFPNASYFDVYLPPSKWTRVTSTFIKEEKTPSLDSLPNECLFEIFRKLKPQPRSLSACVSKRWLMLLSSIRKSEIQTSNADMSSDNQENYGYLTRCLEGEKANDFRLAAIAVGTITRGGLGKLSIRGNRLTHGLTNLGLSAIARGCPTLRALSLYDVPSIGDEGLCEVAKECHLLEKLDISHCPSISDKGLIAIAQNSPNLRDLTIESCPNIGNESFQAIAKWCPKLQCVYIKDSSVIGDLGVASLLSSPGCVLSKLNIQGLSLTDLALAVIGHYGKALTCLTLDRLQSVSEKGFWVMGNAKGLIKLTSLKITSCCGVTDLSLEAIAKGCPGLKSMCFRRCCFVSDNGLVGFVQAATSLEIIHLEECNRITLLGLLGTLSVSKAKLKSLALVKCLGIEDREVETSFLSPCKSLRCLSIRNCPGFGNASLAMVERLCPWLRNIDFTGLCNITDAGLLPLVETCDGLVKVNLSKCFNLTDDVTLAIARIHGGTLELLNLDGCVKITDASLVAIANHCLVLDELDVSNCSITDLGIAVLACEEQIKLQILSLSGCSKVSNKSVSSLIKMGESLVGLNIQLCNSMSYSAILMLLERLCRCDILN